MTADLVTRTRTDAPPRGGLGFVPVVALGVDLMLITLAVALAALGRGAVPFEPLSVSDSVAVAGPAIVLVAVIAIFGFGGYRGTVFGAGLDEYKRVTNAILTTFGVVGIACYLVQLPLSRGFFLLAGLLAVPLAMLGRFAMRRSLQRARQAGTLQYRVLIAGTQGHVDEIAAVLRREKWLGYQVIGAVTPRLAAVPDATASGIPVLGTSEELAATALEVDADIVFLAGGAFDTAAEMRRLGWELERTAVEVVIAPSVTDVAAERISVRPVGGLPLVHLEKPRARASLRRAKRLFDIVGSSMLLLAFSPLFALAALSVWRYDRGPVFFRQERIGRDGEPFSVWKFRSMSLDAEELLEKLHAEQGYSEGLFKMEDDPRVTRPGRWLRRFSVDELPQLLNVLKGDMSLVGPRPPLDHEVEQYDADTTQRLRVRPGMTGLWQVSGRSDLSWREAIRLDLYYVDNWSMLQDLTILARTLTAVVSSRGAY